jgi:hypothetical protein
VEADRVALMNVAQEVCRAILDGSTTPYDGAHRIWDATIAVGDRVRLPELDTFIYAASEWDDRPEDANIFAEGVVAAAKEIVGYQVARSGDIPERWPTRER